MRTRIDGKGGKHEPGSYFYRTPAALCGCIVPAWLDFTFTSVFCNQKEVCLCAGKDHGRAQGADHKGRTYARIMQVQSRYFRIFDCIICHGVYGRLYLDVKPMHRRRSPPGTRYSPRVRSFYPRCAAAARSLPHGASSPPSRRMRVWTA